MVDSPWSSVISHWLNDPSNSVKDDCGDYMFTFYNPPEHWDNSESYWFFKEAK
jgi:hypothetical protein